MVLRGEPLGTVLRFSNPRLTYKGDATGVPGSASSRSVNGPADAARSLNNTRRTVANFRRAPCLQVGAEVRLQASDGHYVIAVGNGGGAVRADQPRAGPWGRFTVTARGVARADGCIRSGETLSLHTSEGFYLRAPRGGGGTLDATAPRATPWARFVVRREPARRGIVRGFDRVSFQTHSGHFVVAEEGGGGAVTANRTEVGAWEQFNVRGLR